MHRLIGFLFIVFCLSLSAAAQPTDPAGDPDNPVPITGIEILIGAGALLGTKKLLQSKRKH